MANDTFEKKYFDEMYDGEYDKRNPEYKFRSYTSEIRPYVKNNGDVLDIGCAYGSFLKQAIRYFNVSGTDISAHAIEIAKQRVPDAGKIWVSDVQSIDKSKSYDGITCFDVLEHVPGIEDALKHIHSLLSPGGVLTITVPVYDTFIGSLVGKLDKDPTHVHKNSRYWWVQLLQEHGYEIVTWKGIWRYYFKGLFYLHYVSKLTRSFTPAIIIIARKK
jgi:2-polyprenyl-3-methyl-5-hydroxy-6-metoxy-1,4-benzoquinol methylase